MRTIFHIFDDDAFMGTQAADALELGNVEDTSAPTNLATDPLGERRDAAEESRFGDGGDHSNHRHDAKIQLVCRRQQSIRDIIRVRLLDWMRTKRDL